MSYNVYLDDIRFPADDSEYWHLVKNFKQFKALLQKKGTPQKVSFDHDLNDFTRFKKHEYTGYTCAKWMLDNEYIPTTVYIHSNNPVGAKRIFNLLKDKISNVFIGSCVKFYISGQN